MEWLVLVGFAILVFIVFGGQQECIRLVTDAGVKKAEANARAEEALTERARIELSRDRARRALTRLGRRE